MKSQTSSEISKTVVIIGTRGYPSYYGGFETAVRKLAPYLADSEWNVTVYGRKGTVKKDDGDRHPLVQSIETRGIESKSLSTLSYGFAAVLHALKNKPDVALVMNCANGFLLPLLKLRRIPTLVNVDGMEWERDKWGRLAKLVFKLGARFTAWFATALVFDAHEIGRRWRDEFGRDGIFIPYGGEFEKNLATKDGFQDRVYALYVARFVPENSIVEFLQAAEVVAKTHDVVIVGSSGYGGELEQRASALAESNPRVHWLGHVNDDERLHALWQHAGVYFHGHSVGGTNPALVQAMALGAPVVARDTAYNREVLPVEAQFVDTNPENIATILLAVLESKETQESLSRANILRAQEEYTWDIVNERYERALGKLAGGKPLS